jgi:hypothetical protein
MKRKSSDRNHRPGPRVKQLFAALSVIGLAVLGLGNAWAAEWRTLRSIERWQLQESEGTRGRKFRITTTALDSTDFALIYRCDRAGADSIVLIRKRKALEPSEHEDYALRYETGTNVRSLVAVGSNGRSFSFQRGSPPYRQLFQDLMRSSLMTFEVEGTKRSFLVGGFMEAAGKLQVQCRSRHT